MEMAKDERVTLATLKGGAAAPDLAPRDRSRFHLRKPL
jgi:hypothetical protein